MKCLTVAILVVTTFANAVAQSAPPVALCGDCSGSMAGEKLEALKEGAKLVAALLDGEIYVIDFGSNARRSSVLPLNTPAARTKAMDYIDSLTLQGGTNYPAAIRRLNTLPQGTIAIFISDGANTNGTDNDVLELLGSAPGPVFTISVGAGGSAWRLLTQMAAKTDGAAVRIENAEDLTKTILNIAQNLHNYRAHTPAEDLLQFSQVAGNMTVIGYDATPKVTAVPAPDGRPYEHHANLPGEHVTLWRTTLSRPTNVVIQGGTKRTPSGRVARVLIDGLARAKVDLNVKDGKVGGGETIGVDISFFDAQDNKLDPRKREDLKAVVLIRDQQDGRVLSKAMAKPSADEPKLIASLNAPTTPGPILVETVTRDEALGPPLDATDTRTIFVEKRVSIQIASTPTTLVESAHVGEFTAKLSIKPSTKPTSPISLTTAISTDSTDLKLVKATTSGDQLSLRFHATKPGFYGGFVSIGGTGSVVVKTLDVPFQITVRPRYRGLDLPDENHSQPLSLGSFLAATGPVDIVLPAVTVLDEIVATYLVEASDLTNGTNVLKSSVAPNSISASSKQQDDVKITIDISDVPAGSYAGQVRYILSDSSPRKIWATPIQLYVTDPLAVKPVEFGNVEPGVIRTAKLAMRNRGSTPVSVKLSPKNIDADGGLIEMTVTQPSLTLSVKQESTLNLQLSVSPHVSTRGKINGAIELIRSNGTPLQIPVRMTIVDNGKGDSALLVAPKPVRLSGMPSEVLEFELSIKLGAEGTQSDQLSIEAGQLRSNGNEATSSVPEMRFVAGNAVAPGKSLGARGFILTPDLPGQYKASLTILSNYSGRVTVPVFVEVR